MNAHNEQQWPEYLMLRDTGLYDDAGGLGQHIFTTAGAGYVKQKYVRADLAAQPSPVVKQNLTTQPAAAQEAVAWPNECSRTVPEALRFLANHERPSGGEDNFNSLHLIQLASEIERMASKPLYAAPVTAAPADHLHAHLLHMLGAKDHEDAGRIIGELHAAAMRTTAAPGIDLVSDILTDLSNVAASWVVEAAGTAADAQNECAMQMHEAIERWSNKLQLGDASPKGDADEPLHAHYCNAQPSSAECICGLNSPKGGSYALAPLGLKLPNVPFAVFDEFGVGADDRIAAYGLACAKAAVQAASTDGGSDPWRGLYAPERAPNRDEYGCFFHPDIPSWDDEREESIAPLLKAQGFDLQCVPGDFSDEAMEEGGERYWQEMREWSPEPEGDGWRLVAIYDTEDGPYSMFVKPLAKAGDAEVQP